MPRPPRDERRRRGGNAPPASIRDVSRAAGVSITTVSHALNGVGRVAAGTQARVATAARHLGYRANPVARHLRGGRSGILAVTNCLPEGAPYGLSDLDYLMRVATAATGFALSHSYSLILMPPAGDPLALEDLPIDGVIVIDPLAGDALLERLAETRTAVVTVGRDAAGSQSDWWVDNDIPGATRAALEHLARAGARRVALLTGPAEQSYVLETRQAYETWIATRGGTPLVGQLRAPFGERAAYGAAHALLARPDRPDAIYAVLERFALRALAAAEDLALRVPQDVRIATGSDSAAAQAAHPPLTALDLHPDKLGRAAVEMLIARVEGREPGDCHRLIDATLEVRGSTAA